MQLSYNMTLIIEFEILLLAGPTTMGPVESWHAARQMQTFLSASLSAGRAASQYYMQVAKPRVILLLY